MESCDSGKRNVLLRIKSAQELAITFGENVLRYSNGWQYKLLKLGELCSGVLAEPVDMAAVLCLCQQPPAQMSHRTQREGAAVLLHAASFGKEGRLGRRCDG